MSGVKRLRLLGASDAVECAGWIGEADAHDLGKRGLASVVVWLAAYRDIGIEPGGMTSDERAALDSFFSQVVSLS